MYVYAFTIHNIKSPSHGNIDHIIKSHYVITQKKNMTASSLLDKD